MYDDFEEFAGSAGSAKRVQQMLRAIYGVATILENVEGGSDKVENQSRTESGIMTDSSDIQGRSSRSITGPGSMKLGLTQEDLDGTDEPGSFRGTFVSKEISLPTSNKLWAIACFTDKPPGVKAHHLEVPTKSWDAHLLASIRSKFYSRRRAWRRVLGLKDVTNVQFVKASKTTRQEWKSKSKPEQFHLMPSDIVDVQDRDRWPPPERNEWLYEPCPIPPDIKEPLLGPNYLLHLWRNPCHADFESYNNMMNQAKRLDGLSNNLRTWLRNMLSVYDRDLDVAFQDDSKNLEDPQLPLRSNILYNTYPKRQRERLELLGSQASGPAQGWSLLLEEGFRPHRALFIALIIYACASVATVIWVGSKYGLSPTTGWQLLACFSWVSSFLSLLLTTWYKWAEN